jgi:hypothetical protein
MDGRMLAALRSEAHALAQLETLAGHGPWSINATAGTVIDLRDQSLVAYLHPATLDPIPGAWLLMQAGGNA